MLRRITNLALFTSLVALYASACSLPGNTTEAWAGTVDTLPNGTVWVSNPEEAVWDEDSRWTLTEELRIGSLDSGGPDQFGEAWAILADSAGTIYVADRKSKDVRVFDADGRHVRTLGREGAGPGEFQSPFGMSWGPDGNLWVVDIRNARYSVLNPAGELVTTYPRTALGYSWPWAGGFTRDSVLLEEDLSQADGAPLVAYRLVEDRLVATDTFPDPLGSPTPDDYDFFDLTDDDGLGSIVAIPFGRSWVRALDRVGGVWVGHNREYRIAHQTLEGDTVMLIGRETPPVPVELRDRSDAVAQLSDHRDHPGIDLNQIPNTKPWFAALLPAPDGSLWVLRNLAGSSWAFDVFDSRGRFLGTIDLPFEPALLPPPQILENGVLAVTRDGMHVPYVVRLELKRGTRDMSG